jgi:glycine cleavage system H protein
MADSGLNKSETTGIVVLPCSGLDKEAGSASREISLLLSERGVPVICPVLYQRSPKKYEKELGAGRLVVIDGCKTGCASKLAADRGLKIARKLTVTEAAKALGVKAGRDPHLTEALREILPSLAEELQAAEPIAAPVGEVTAGTFCGAVSYREFSVDKFLFRVPDSGYFFNENDCWARVEGGRARVGVSDYVQQSAADMILFDPPSIGAEVDIFDEVGSLETTKTALDIISPVSGKVAAVNQEVVEAPELINQDPYESGWAVEIELENFADDRELLMDSSAYFDYLKQKAEREHKELYGG